MQKFNFIIGAGILLSAAGLMSAKTIQVNTQIAEDCTYTILHYTEKFGNRPGPITEAHYVEITTQSYTAAAAHAEHGDIVYSSDPQICPPPIAPIEESDPQN